VTTDRPNSLKRTEGGQAESGRDDLPGEFVGEELSPEPGTADAAAMSRREPGLPARFTWRQTAYRVAGIISQWKTHGPCRNGSGETYLRRHWYKVLTDPPAIMTVYCDRQAKNPRRPRARWWVYTIEQAGEGAAGRRVEP
jgi:hypothetical protein